MGINGKVNAFFLDRDGVLNESVIKNGKPYPPDSINDLIIPKKLKKNLLKLRKLNFLLIMITNQPDVARGTRKKNDVDEINNYLKNYLNLDDVYCCYHDDLDDCICRKPKDGMIKMAKKKWNINLSKSFLVGDRWKDIKCGINAGVKTFLIEKKYDEQRIEPDFSVSNFDEIIKIINNYKYE